MRKKLVLLLVLITLLFSGCSPEGGFLQGKKKSDEVEKQIIDVESYIAEPKELTVESNYIGTIVPKDRVSIIPTASGVVEKVLVIEGEKVTLGQVLFKINDDIAQNSLDRAETAYDQTMKSRDQMLGAKVELEDYNHNETIAALNSSITDLEATKSALTLANAALAVQLAPYTDRETAQKKYMMASQYSNEYELIKLSWADSAGDIDISTSSNPAASALYIEMQNDTPSISAYDITMLGLADLKGIVDDFDTYNSNAAQILEIQSSIDALKEQRTQTVEIKKYTDKMNDETAAVYNEQLRSAKIGIEAAEIQLDGYTITSPINGTVETINVSEDEMVSQATYAIMVSDKSHMIVQFYVSKKVRDNLSLDDEVEIDVGSEVREAKISQIAVVKNAQKGLYKIEASIIGNTDNLLSDISVDVKATTLRDNGGLAIPYDSVYFSGDKAYVYAIENGVAIKKYVETGSFNDEEILITSGIDNGDEIICSWAPNLENGSLVSAK